MTKKQARRLLKAIDTLGELESEHAQAAIADLWGSSVGMAPEEVKLRGKHARCAEAYDFAKGGIEKALITASVHLEDKRADRVLFPEREETEAA